MQPFLCSYNQNLNSDQSVTASLHTSISDVFKATGAKCLWLFSTNSFRVLLNIIEVLSTNIKTATLIKLKFSTVQG